jgi:hypothetical protein
LNPIQAYLTIIFLVRSDILDERTIRKKSEKWREVKEEEKDEKYAVLQHEEKNYNQVSQRGLCTLGTT